eukprot:gene24197-biopygen7376
MFFHIACGVLLFRRSCAVASLQLFLIEHSLPFPVSWLKQLWCIVGLGHCLFPGYSGPRGYQTSSPGPPVPHLASCVPWQGMPQSDQVVHLHIPRFRFPVSQLVTAVASPPRAPDRREDRGRKRSRDQPRGRREDRRGGWVCVGWEDQGFGGFPGGRTISMSHSTRGSRRKGLQWVTARSRPEKN